MQFRLFVADKSPECSNTLVAFYNTPIQGDTAEVPGRTHRHKWSMGQDILLLACQIITQMRMPQHSW